MKKYFLFVSIFCAVTACSVSNKSDLDKDVKAFLADFNSKLSQSDEVIWKQFMTLQNKEEIFKVIRILQNRESKDLKTEFLYDEASTKFEDGMFSVEVPIIMHTPDEIIETQIAMGLFRKDRLYVANVKGERLYTQFFAYRSETEGKAMIDELILGLKSDYQKAKELQKNFDSVIWYVKHNDVTYYYVVNGKYGYDSLTENNKGLYKMGLIDETGKIIIPVEYDLIGTPSIAIPETIEVTKGNSIGYYSMKGEQLIKPEYEWLAPIVENESIAILKKDSSYYWVDKNFTVHNDFPSNHAKELIVNYKYLTENKFVIGRGTNEIIHVIDPTLLTREFFFRNHGMVIPPKYFVRNGIFEETANFVLWEPDYERGFYSFGNVYTENSNDPPFSITETLEAFVSKFKTKFVGGRGEFYVTNRIVLRGVNNNLVSSINTYGWDDFKFKRINESLFESKFQHERMEPDEILEQNFPGYNYFSFDGIKLRQLDSNRRFNFTEFVKIDSAYLSGDFITMDVLSNSWKEGHSNFVSKRTLEVMRDEILADNGFIFNDTRYKEYTPHWYKPTTESYEEVYSKASEIDKYNLDFLNKLIGSTPSSKPI